MSVIIYSFSYLKAYVRNYDYLQKRKKPNTLKKKPNTFKKKLTM